MPYLSNVMPINSFLAIRIPEKLWSAPEVLRKGLGALSSDQLQRADVYSMGIIMNELFCRQGTFPSPPGVYDSPTGKGNACCTS